MVGPGFSLDIYTFVVTEECKDDIQELITRTWGHSSVRGAVAVGQQAGRLVTDVSLRYSLYMNLTNFKNNIKCYEKYMKRIAMCKKIGDKPKIFSKKVRQ